METSQVLPISGHVKLILQDLAATVLIVAGEPGFVAVVSGASEEWRQTVRVKASDDEILIIGHDTNTAPAVVKIPKKNRGGQGDIRIKKMTGGVIAGNITARGNMIMGDQVNGTVTPTRLGSNPITIMVPANTDLEIENVSEVSVTGVNGKITSNACKLTRN